MKLTVRVVQQRINWSKNEGTVPPFFGPPVLRSSVFSPGGRLAAFIFRFSYCFVSESVPII